MKSIKQKIILVISLTCILCLLVSSGVSYYISYNAVMDQSKGKIISEAGKYSEEINGWLDSEGKILSEISDCIGQMDISDGSKILSYLQQKTKSNTNSLAVYAGFTDKRYIDGSGWTPDKDFDCTQRDWYKNAMNKKDLVYSEPYVDAESKNMVISISKPIMKNGEIVGAVSTDFKLDTITDKLNKAKLVDNSYAFLLDNKNNFIVHKNKEFNPTESGAKNISKVMNGSLTKVLNSSIVLLKDYDGKNKYFVTSKIKAANWTIGIAVAKSELEKPLQPLILGFLLIIAAALAFSIIISLFFGAKLGNPIKVITKLLNKTSNLDLTEDNSCDYLLKEKDEIGQLANATIVMKNSIADLIKNVKEESYAIESVVDTVNTQVSKLNSNVEDVSATTEELSAGMEETTASAEEMSAMSQEIEKAVKSIAEKSQEGAAQADKINERAEDTKVNVQAALKKTNEIFMSTKEELEGAIEESKVVEQITVLSQAIMEITDQTNLLSLNASIEAARAGEAGKGFSVVADEIRALADQSKNTASEIQNVTSRVMHAVKNLSDNSNNLLKYVETDVKRDLGTMLQVADKYSGDARYVNGLVIDFSSTSEELLASNSDVSQSVQGVAQAASEGTTGIVDISDKIAKITNMSSEVVNEVKKAKSSADKLKNEISKFKI